MSKNSDNKKPSSFSDDEWRDWYHLTPAKRWQETEKLRHFYIAVGGSLDPEPDSQSPFRTAFTQGGFLKDFADYGLRKKEKI